MAVPRGRLGRLGLLALLGLAACDKPTAERSVSPTVVGPRLDPAVSIDTVAFGSCLDQSRPHPILGDVVNAAPDVMVMLGDNVYADAGTVADFERAYQALGDSPAYQRMAAAMPILAAWDDHDYGRNDVGKEFELKAESKTVMLDFFGEPHGTARRSREGNYDAVRVGPRGQQVQILLLDTRWFRDALEAGGAVKQYLPQQDPGLTVLGEAQWAWLEAQLREPADVRFLISSIQLVVAEHRFESWGLFPAERRRLLNLIGKTGASGVLVVSGDRHRGELSCGYDEAVGYPLIELTASSINRPNHNEEENRFRLQGLPAVGDENFGLVRIDWQARTVRLALRGIGGATHIETAVSLDALRPGRGREGVPGCEPM